MDATPNAARALARSAYLWAYPLVVNYGRLHAETVASALPPGALRVGPWVRRMAPAIDIERQTLTETEMSWSTWLDLRDSAWLLVVPATEVRLSRVRRTIDLWGFSVQADSESRATRTLFLPGVSADEGLDDVSQLGVADQVLRVEPGFIRTELSVRLSKQHPVDETIRFIEDNLALESASPGGGPASRGPGQVPGLRWRPYRAEAEITREFWSTANFALSLVEPHRTDRKVLERVAEIGLVAGQPWDETTFPPEVVEAIDEGMDDAISELLSATSRLGHPAERAELVSWPQRSLSRADMDQDYFARALWAVQYSRVG